MTGYGIELAVEGWFQSSDKTESYLAALSAPEKRCSQLRGFTLQGPSFSGKYYGIHAESGCTNIVMDDLEVKDMSRTCINLNVVEDSILTSVRATGSTSGFGLAMSSCQNMTITDMQTSGNSWGGIGIWPSRTQYQILETGNGSPTDTVFTDLESSDIAEGGVLHVQGGYSSQQLRTGEMWEPTICNTASTEPSCDVTVPEAFDRKIAWQRASDGGFFHAIGPLDKM